MQFYVLVQRCPFLVSDSFIVKNSGLHLLKSLHTCNNNSTNTVVEEHGYNIKIEKMYSCS